MNIAKIAFTVLLTVPILILILFLLTKLVSQLGKGTQKPGTARHADDGSNDRRTVNSKTENRTSRRNGKEKREV